MAIIVNLDVMMAKRKMSATELSKKLGITMANLSILKNNKAKAVRFTTLNETYLLPEKKFKVFLETKERKSIPLDFFRNYGYLIKDGYRPRVDYLKIVDELIGGI